MINIRKLGKSTFAVGDVIILEDTYKKSWDAYQILKMSGFCERLYIKRVYPVEEKPCWVKTVLLPYGRRLSLLEWAEWRAEHL